MKKNQLQLKKIKTFLIIAFMLLSVSGAQAIIKTAATGNWNTAGTWTPSGVPASTDDIIIPTGVTVTLNTDFTSSASITLEDGGKIYIARGNDLIINGTINFNGTNANQITYATNVNNGNKINLTFGPNCNFKTVNQNGIIGTNCSLEAAASFRIVNLGTTTNYEFNGTTNQATLGLPATPATVNNLIISNTGGIVTLNASTSATTVTINPGSKLTNDGSLTATTFTIQSDAVAGTGTYLGSGTVSATTTYVNQALNVNRGWYMTSPVDGAVTPTTNSGALTIYRYLESANDDQTTGVSWLSSSTVSRDQGYSITSPSGTTNVTFSGSLNDGPQSFTLTRNDHAGKSKNGFNLIGNPYPSFLEWQEVYAANSSVLSTPTMWYRTKVASTYYFWTVNGAGGLGTPAQANDTIPPMQAFWVYANTGGGTLNLTNAMRVHNTTTTSNLLKAPAAKTALNQILRLQVSSGATTDEAVVYFNANAADGFDAYDSPKMINGSTSTVPDFYTTVGIEKLAINGMSAIPYDTEIPLHFVANASAGTSYSITANELADFEAGTQVWIKNKLSGVEQLVSDGTPFTFNIADIGTNPKFSIIIKAPGAATQLVDTKNNNIFAYLNDNNQITVSCSDALSSDANVSVYNSLGQRIVRKALTENVTRIDNTLNAGVYLVTVINAGNKTTEKIIIR